MTADTTIPQEQATMKQGSVIAISDEFNLEDSMGSLDDTDTGLAADGSPADGSYRDAHNKNTTRQHRNEILKTKKEAHRVFMFRGMLAGMLVLAAVFTGLAYYFLSRQETERFETAVRTCLPTVQCIMGHSLFPYQLLAS